MNILTVVGARPQFIKAALLSRAIKKHCTLREIVVHTGQHYDYNMSQSFFIDFDMPKPRYNLCVGSMPRSQQLAHIMLKLEPVLETEKPKAVIVYGDTNSTLAAAICARAMDIPVYHVEAGLRSFDARMPEETNRVLTDHAATLLFCPTKNAVNNLYQENIKDGVYNVGDIMYELLLKTLPVALKKSKILEKLGLQSGRYTLVTVHRKSNADIAGNLESIVQGLCSAGCDIVFPVHPRTKKALLDSHLFRELSACSNINLIDPVGYLDMLCLERNARKIVTDSGGVQKEAYFLRVPCVTLRENTEWVETLDSGCNVLIGTDACAIAREIKSKKTSRCIYRRHYGSGNTSQTIVNIMSRFLEV